MDREQTARGNHRSGVNCALSVFSAFADTMGLTPREAAAAAPRPRGEGGQCGAFLAGRDVLRRLKPEAVAAYEQRYIALNGTTACVRLAPPEGVPVKPCND